MANGPFGHMDAVQEQLIAASNTGQKSHDSPLSNTRFTQLITVHHAIGTRKWDTCVPPVLLLATKPYHAMSTPMSVVVSDGHYTAVLTVLLQDSLVHPPLVSY